MARPQRLELGSADVERLRQALSERWSRRHTAPISGRGAFAREGLTLRGTVDDVALPSVRVVNFQGSHQNFGDACDFYINAGVYFVGLHPRDGVDPARVKEYQCHVRQRIGTPSPLGQSWALPSPRSVHALAEELGVGPLV